MSLIQANTKVSAGGYEIAQSIRFDKTTSSKLQQTQVTPDGNSWTISFWLKRGKIDASEMFIVNGGNGNPDYIRFETSEKIRFRIYSQGIDNTTTAVFRDPSAWYHFVANYNASTGAYNLWQNNVSLISGTGSAGATDYNKASTLFTLMAAGNSVAFTDGYLAEVVKQDNIVSDPTAFGEYNDDGVWIPKRFEGTYGSNGFYLKGQDSAALGDDSSGNGNDFTPTGLTSDDQVTDTPTDNYATLNPLDDATGYTTPLISNGNLDVDDRTGNAVRGNFGFKEGDGKYVYEVNITNLIGSMDLGWSAAGVDLWAVNGPELMYEDDAKKLVSADSSSTPTRTSYGASYTTGDVIRVETDFDASVIEFFKNGTSQGTIDFSGMNDGTLYFPACYCNRVDAEFNFGQQPFIGTPTAGFKALSTANLPEPTIKDGSAYFQTTLFTGTGSTLEVNQTGNSTFQPDFVWIKQRNKTDNHIAADIVNGSYNGYQHYVNNTNSAVQTTEGVTSFDADGFTLGPWNNVNQSGITAVAWQWLASNSTGSNADGDITSTVSANTTSGFSVVGYTGNGSASQTIGHGLGVTPSTLVIFPVSNGDNKLISNWETGVTAFTEKLKLNDTDAASGTGSTQIIGGSSTTFTVGTDSNVNGSGNTYVAFCWAEVEGFSKFGTYTGNGSADGPFLWCGFKPAFLMFKRTDSADNWAIYDTARDTYNYADKYLYADQTSTEATYSTGIDILSNGFKWRMSVNFGNASGGTYIFMAFAEHPFGGDGVAPVPAR